MARRGMTPNVCLSTILDYTHAAILLSTILFTLYHIILVQQQGVVAHATCLRIIAHKSHIIQKNYK